MNEDIYEGDGTDKACWGFIGDCGGDALLEQHGPHKYIVDTAQYVAWMKMGVAFLLHTFGNPPAGCVLGILWAQGPHGPGKFPIIAMGFEDGVDPDSEEITKYFESITTGLEQFDKAVNWQSLPRKTTQLESN